MKAGRTRIAACAVLGATRVNWLYWRRSPLMLAVFSIGFFGFAAFSFPEGTDPQNARSLFLDWVLTGGALALLFVMVFLAAGRRSLESRMARGFVQARREGGRFAAHLGAALAAWMVLTSCAIGLAVLAILFWLVNFRDFGESYTLRPRTELVSTDGDNGRRIVLIHSGDVHEFAVPDPPAQGTRTLSGEIYPRFVVTTPDSPLRSRCALKLHLSDPQDAGFRLSAIAYVTPHRPTKFFFENLTGRWPAQLILRLEKVGRFDGLRFDPGSVVLLAASRSLFPELFWGFIGVGFLAALLFSWTLWIGGATASPLTWCIGLALMFLAVSWDVLGLEARGSWDYVSFLRRILGDFAQVDPSEYLLKKDVYPRRNILELSLVVFLTWLIHAWIGPQRGRDEASE